MNVWQYVQLGKNRKLRRSISNRMILPTFMRRTIHFSVVRNPVSRDDQ